MIEHLIDGKPVASREAFATVNPANPGGARRGRVRAARPRSPRPSPPPRRAFPGWAGTPQATRAQIMRRLGDLIAAHVPEISELGDERHRPGHRPDAKALVPRAADNFYYFAEMCTRMDGHTYPVDGTLLNYTLFQPVGVCALISPWNVPFMTATWKVAPCLALRQHGGAQDERAVADHRRPPGRAGAGGRRPAGRAQRRARLRPHGRRGARPASGRARDLVHRQHRHRQPIVQRAGLKKFSMELGGKTPFVVFDDADRERAMDAAVFMIFSNNGERCTAGSRILVQRSIYDRFVETFAARASRLAVGDPMDEATIIGPMISPEHLAKVRRYIEMGPGEGASWSPGGLDAPAAARARCATATSCGRPCSPNVRNDMKIAQDEIFGPVACLIPFDDEADAAAHRQRHALRAVVVRVDGKPRPRAPRRARRIEAGMCFVNSQNVRDLRQPFGGIKASGTGREGGTWSFEVFLEPKNVCVSLGSHPIPRWGAE